MKRWYAAGMAGLVFLLAGCGGKTAGGNYEDGLEAYKAGKYQEAAGFFAEAVRINPDKAEYYLDSGFNFIQLGNYEEAVKQFETIIMDKEITMVKENNKRAYRGIGISNLKAQKYNEAIINFDKALEIKIAADLDLDILAYKGSTLEKQGMLPQALENYTSMLEISDKNAAVYNARADVYRKLSKLEESIADYDKAIELSAASFSIYFGKYAALKELGREAEATDVLGKAASIEIKTDEDKFNLAKVHFYQGNYTSAVVEFNDSISKGYFEGTYYLGEIYLQQQEYQKAAEQFQIYLQNEKSPSVMVYNQLAVCYLQLEDFDKAEETINKAKSMPDVSVAQALQRNEIALLEKTGRFQEALNKMTTYIAAYSQDTDAKTDYEFLKKRVKSDEVEPTPTPEEGGSDPVVGKP